ncbi:MAG: TlpA disulfide reductase family protein [bacterium]|nr:TlpA disulfide reductase family protein [bacterium]
MIPLKQLQNNYIYRLVITLSVCVCFLITSCARSKPQVTLDRHPQAPDFSLTSIDGDRVYLSSFIGKVVILEFWYSWDPLSKKQAEYLQHIQNVYSKRKVVILAVVMDEGSLSPARLFTKKFGITYKVLIGEKYVYELYGGIRSFPTIFMIDRQGRIYGKGFGLQKLDVLEPAVLKLLEE